MKKKLLSLALSLTMCCCLTLSACAVGTGDAAAPDNTESTAEAFAGSGNDYEGTVDTFDSSENDSESTTGTSVSSEDAPVTSIEKFANSAGDTEIKEAYGTITLSNPILYTIPTSDLGKIDISSAELTIEGLPYDENSFGCPASEYPSRYIWPDVSAVYAVPAGTIVTFPSGIITASMFMMDVISEKGTFRSSEMTTYLFSGYDSVKTPEPDPDPAYIAVIDLWYTDVPETIRVTPGGSGGGGSTIGDNDAGAIAFYVSKDGATENPFGSSAPAAPAAPASPTKFIDVSASSPFADAINWAVEQGITTGKTDTTFAPGEKCTNGQILTFLWRANGSPEPAISNPYQDTIPNSFQKAAIWTSEKGLVTGSTFGSDTPCTRSMVVTYLWQLAGKPAASGSASFPDVASGAAYAQAVAWAVENGITTGKTDGAFAPGDVCTRGQIVTFLYRAFK